MHRLLKPEGLQPIGAFKLRGGYNKIASLTPEERARGVIAFSSGNHAQGVAYAARALGIAAVIVMPARAPEIKRARTEAMGAEVVLLHEGGEEEWRAHAEALAMAALDTDRSGTIDKDEFLKLFAETNAAKQSVA